MIFGKQCSEISELGQMRHFNDNIHVIESYFEYDSITLPGLPPQF